MFCQPKHFKSPPYKIPNQQEFAEGLTAFKELLGDQEEDILKSLLGYDLYTEFTEALEASGELDEKWANLRDGTTYVYNGVTYQWKGLVDLLKPALYSEWLPINHRKNTSSGVVVNKGQQNTETQNPMPDIVKAWNVFVIKAGSCANSINSFYGFMKANEDDYDGWEFTEPELKNQFDI